jgi:AcrB/AcrD/AcrF family
VRGCSAHRVLTLAAAVLVLAGALALVARFGREFMPLLNEGDLMFMPIADPAISLPHALTITQLQNEAIQKVPKLAEVVAKVARAGHLDLDRSRAPQHDGDHRGAEILMSVVQFCPCPPSFPGSCSSANRERAHLAPKPVPQPAGGRISWTALVAVLAVIVGGLLRAWEEL